MSRRPFRSVTFRLKLLRQAICFYLNKSLENGKFPNCLKLANITPVFKKGARASKNTYGPVSILPVYFKDF